MSFLSLNIHLSPHPIVYIHIPSNKHFLHIIFQLLVQELEVQLRAMAKPIKRNSSAGSWFFGVLLLCLILLGCVKESYGGDVRGKMFERPCDEIYTVREGETLHSISHKCNDPFIIERNPHINDPDDVFPGLIIKIIPTNLH